MRLFAKLRGFTIAALLALAAVSPALAQISPGGAFVVFPGVKPTFTASVVGFAPAASPTDFMSLTGSASKLVRVVDAGCDGTATAAANHVLQAVLRSTADTGGTPTTLTAVEHDPGNNPVATAVATSYAANPTLGTSTSPFGVVRSQELYQSVVSTGAYTPGLFFQPFLSLTSNQSFVLRGAAQTFALNGNASSFAAGTLLNCHITWTEG